MRRLAACLLALTAFLGLVAVPQPAAADGPISTGVEVACDYGGGLLGHAIISGVNKLTHSDLCDKVGDATQKKVSQAWKSVWDSLLGDVIKSGQDATKWIIRKVLTVALLGPSLDLEATGLFGQGATLAGMLTWLGLVIAAAGAMWQIGKMAVTGQTKHLGRAMAGWVENLVLSAIGVGIVATLLQIGDALTNGLVNATFSNNDQAYDRIVAVMVPAGVSNPVIVIGIVLALLLIGFIQMILVFLRQSAIPIQCLLLPVAGAGRVGGDATRQWAPRLITSIMVVITYKPILAVIICTGFAEFGSSKTLAEWLRGCATLLLAVLAPGPLTRIFAPFGEAVGAGMASGGISGAFVGAAGFIAGRGNGGDGAGAAPEPATPMQHAQFVEHSMGPQSGQPGRDGQDGQRGDAQAQAARNESAVPRQASGQDGSVPVTGAPTGSANAAAGAGTGQAAGAAGVAAIGIQVLDGVSNGIKGASRQIGNGGNTQ
ncbi:hypothetical protein [Streptomyces mexicanus]|uniref:PE-PGRS family protein n=1 Tax=Streptomyces mexicanus TaxID=178566 RepID=A0A7X1I6T4_9ACTN|nr:hypothetical protein [Streptomyces mexicanus]MBC2869864.1 hypothetical protein [Streptomyces mexicanus]